MLSAQQVVPDEFITRPKPAMRWAMAVDTRMPFVHRHADVMELAQAPNADHSPRESRRAPGWYPRASYAEFKFAGPRVIAPNHASIETFNSQQPSKGQFTHDVEFASGAERQREQVVVAALFGRVFEETAPRLKASSGSVTGKGGHTMSEYLRKRSNARDD